MTSVPGTAGSEPLPVRVAFVALRPPRAATGETATIAYHHHVLEERMGITVTHLAGNIEGAFSLSRFSSASLDHLGDVRRQLAREPQLPIVWFVPSPGQIPLVSWTMRGLVNPAAAIIEGASLSPEGDWLNAVRRMPRFMATRAVLNGEQLARLSVVARPVALATASQYHLNRLRRVLPRWPAVWLPNGSPDLPLQDRWQPPASPTPRLIGHALFNKGGDLAFAAAALVARQRPDLTMDWARPDTGRIPSDFIPASLHVRIHQLVDPYSFLAEASVVMVPLRLSCGTNVFPNVLIEAMSVGAPILTSDLPAHRELLGPDASDALVPDFQPATWANHLAGLLDEPARARALGGRLLKRARQLWGDQEPVERWAALLTAMGVSVPASR